MSRVCSENRKHDLVNQQLGHYQPGDTFHHQSNASDSNGLVEIMNIATLSPLIFIQSPLINEYNLIFVVFAIKADRHSGKEI